MKLQLPRKRTILALHRWLGLAAALFLVSLSLTGLALNHTETLQLDQIKLHNRLILERYGMASGHDIAAHRINDSHTLAYLDDALFYDGRMLTTGSQPLGLFEDGALSVVGTAEQLIYLTAEGEVVEILASAQLPYDQLQAMGLSESGRPVLVADNGLWTADEDWIELQAYSGSYRVDPLDSIELSPAESSAILQAFQGGGVSLYRVLLDLHSGRLFGWGGRTAMDLTALAILLLVSSGIAGWLRKSRHPKKSRH